LGVIARRESDHAVFALIFWQARQGRPAAAKLERASVLEAFGFDKHGLARDLVKKGRREEGSSARVTFKANGCGADHIDIHRRFVH
jgi:hypothetical protein